VDGEGLDWDYPAGSGDRRNGDTVIARTKASVAATFA
jgi:hypothetical protein